ncbi:Uncharacterised protein [uncultured archaeon]|nr:Uncharacterised protein [uncultured archaeon]
MYLINCGICGMPTPNPQGVCELCKKSRNQSQARMQRRDKKIERQKELLVKNPEEEDARLVWADEEP